MSRLRRSCFVFLLCLCITGVLSKPTVHDVTGTDGGAHMVQVSIESRGPFIEIRRTENSGDMWKQLDHMHDDFLQHMSHFRSLVNRFPLFDSSVFDRMEKQMTEMESAVSSMSEPKTAESSGAVIESTGRQPMSLNPLFRYAQSLINSKSNSMMSFPPSFDAAGRERSGNDFLIVRMVPLATGPEIQRFPSIQMQQVDSTEIQDVTEHSDDSWFGSFSRFTGRMSLVTRSLLLFAMIMCVISMLWIGLAIIRTAPKRRICTNGNMTHCAGFSKPGYFDESKNIVILSSEVPFDLSNCEKNQPIVFAAEEFSIAPPPTMQDAPPPYDSQMSAPEKNADEK